MISGLECVIHIGLFTIFIILACITFYIGCIFVDKSDNYYTTNWYKNASINFIIIIMFMSSFSACVCGLYYLILSIVWLFKSIISILF